MGSAASAADDGAALTFAANSIVIVGERDKYLVTDGSSATKSPTPILNVPQTVTTITARQLEDQAITQLGDALRYVPGVTLDTGEGHRDAVYIRGQSSTADFYLDGLRDDAQYYRPLYNVARVEVLKGANALIFGRGGGGGVINRVSKTADPSRSSFTLGAGIDSFGAYKLSGGVNQPLGTAVAARVDAAYERFDSARDFVGGRFVGVSPALTIEPDERTRITASATYDDDRRTTDRGLPSLAGRPLTGYDRTFFGDPAFNKASSTARIARARIEHDLSDSLTVDLTAQVARYAKFYANVVPAKATATSATLDGYASSTDRDNRIVQGNATYEHAIGRAKGTLLAGFEFGRQDTAADRSEILFATGGATVTVPLARVLAVPAARLAARSRATESHLRSGSGYVQEQLDLGIMQLIGGVRFDSFALDSTNLINGFAARRTDTKWSPRVGVVVKPREDVSLYASMATSFLPQSGDQFGALDPITADLAPEKFRNLELGAKWAPTPALLATAAVFRLDRTNTRAADPANPGLTVLTGATRIEGFEASLAGKPLPNLQASLGYTYLDGAIRSATTAAPAGRRPQQLPRHQASAWTRYDLTPSFGLGLGAVWQSAQFASISNAVTLPGWVRVDAAAYWTVNDRLSFQLNAENLFDANYYSSAHGDNNIQPGDPLTVQVSAKLRL
jgi:catecholate siderophore receptor